MPKDEGTIGFEHKGIGAVLHQNRLVVPLNQREYSWEGEHVRELFMDFSNAIEPRGTYFLGTLVLTKGEGDVPEVSDGQQRLATTSILIAAVRDYLYHRGEKSRASAIEHDYLLSVDLETDTPVPKLKLNVDDNNFFTDYVISPPGSPGRKAAPTKESHKRIQKAAEIAREHITKVLSSFSESDRTSRILEWIKFLKTGAQVIVLRVPDHLNAFVMFETLNDRGLKASQADLVKNYLLSHCGEDRIAEGQQKWAKMLGVLESLGHDDITVTYLHHLLITREGPTKERDVFDKVKTLVSSKKRALEFLDDLAEGASDYAALFNSDHKKWNEYGTRTRKHIATMNRDLRVEQIRPLMFAVAKSFSVKEGQTAFKLFVFWSVRFLIVGGRGGLLDRNYSLRAQEVGTGKIKNAKQLAEALSEVIPSDALFEAAFAEARVSQAHLARYYLRALELKRKGEQEPEFVPMDEENVINLEHVLPENPKPSEWSDIDVDTAAAHYRRLGNMAIMQAKKNAAFGNDSFAVKKPILKESAFLLTKEIGETPGKIWGVKEIGERQKRLAKLAVQTWPLA